MHPWGGSGGQLTAKIDGFMANSIARCCVSPPSGSRLTIVEVTSPAKLTFRSHISRYAEYMSWRTIVKLKDSDLVTCERQGMEGQGWGRGARRVQKMLCRG